MIFSKSCGESGSLRSNAALFTTGLREPKAVCANANAGLSTETSTPPKTAREATTGRAQRPTKNPKATVLAPPDAGTKTPVSPTPSAIPQKQASTTYRKNLQLITLPKCQKSDGTLCLFRRTFATNGRSRFSYGICLTTTAQRGRSPTKTDATTTAAISEEPTREETGGEGRFTAVPRSDATAATESVTSGVITATTSVSRNPDAAV